MYAAGLQLIGPAGKTWLYAPQPGNLTSMDAGFSTTLGTFSSKYNITSTGGSFEVCAPEGTKGSVRIALTGQSGSAGLYDKKSGKAMQKRSLSGISNGHVEFNEVKGGEWVIKVE